MLGLRMGRGGGAHRKRRSQWVAAGSALAVGAALLGAVNSGALGPALFGRAAAQAATVTPVSGMLNHVVPRRILDTRTTTGGHHAKLGSGATMTLPVLGQGIPSAGVSAVLVNVTAVGESTSGYLTFFPSGISRPVVSTVNYRTGVTIANEAMVPVGSDGTISIFNSAGTVDVLVDVEGWVGIDTAAANGQTTTATPVRALDTRTTTGGHKAPLGSSQSLTLPVEGVGQVPASGVAAVYANITAVPVGKAAGYLTAYPGGSSQPLASTVNFMSGVTTANLVLLAVSASGTITITNHSAGANVLVDVMGWTSGGDGTSDAGIQAVTPARILDTRTTTGGHKAPVGANATISVRALGVGGVPATGVAAVAVHVTGVTPTGSTYLTAWATGYPKPGSSVLNLTAGATVANTVLVPVGPAGTISVYNQQGSLNVVIDVEGWIAAPVLTVVPPVPSALSAGPLTSTDGAKALSILTNANRYAVTTWWKSIYPSLAGAPMKSEILNAISPDNVPALTFSATTVNTTDAVRRLSMEAFSLATSIATGAYNPAAAPAGTGVLTATATYDTLQIINKVASSHMVNMSGGWGATSESELDATYIGTAAWLLWPDLSSTLQSQVAKMVYFEAEWGMDQPLGFYANAAGTVLHPGDTQADGDSWVVMPTQLATVMMPSSSQYPMWMNAVVRNAITSWSRPSDDTSTNSANGAMVSLWINNGGSNVLSTGDLYNHHRYAPDYSTLIYQNMQDILLSSLAGVPAPEASTTLLAPVYAAYTTVSYPAPPNDSPGGTVYTPNSAAIYYPQGCDWGTGQELPYALVDAESSAFGVGTSTSASYESLHATAELTMQNAHADGHTYDSNTQYSYVGREEHTAQLAAQLYLTMYVRDHSLVQALSSTSYWLGP